MTIGIYRIINTATNSSYIGSSYKIEKRIKRHANELKNNIHHNIKMMNDFLIYGESVFEFEILKEYETIPARQDLYADEDLFISQYDTKNTGYNIADARFGDTLTHHPDRLGRIQRMRKTLKNTISSMTEEKRKMTYGKPKELNGRWRNDLHRNCKKCGKELTSHHGKHGSGYCNSCRDRNGTNNPFYGKKHSAETIEKLRTINKNRTGKNNPCSKKIYADGLIFDSMIECAKHFGKSAGTITYRVKSSNFPNYYYL